MLLQNVSENEMNEASKQHVYPNVNDNKNNTFTENHEKSSEIRNDEGRPGMPNPHGAY